LTKEEKEKKKKKRKKRKEKKRREKREKGKARSNRIFNRYFPSLRVNLVTESGNNEKILSRSLASSYFLSRGR